MQGYLDDPALTAASFSAGFLGTGDLARRRADGRVELVGRIKEIVSRGGNKIAPAEIENLFAAIRTWSARSAPACRTSASARRCT